MHGNMTLRPWEIDRMILPEIELALAEDLEKPFGAVQLQGQDEVEYANWYRSLTWEQRIDLARD